MGVLVIGSILATATIAQVSPQEISLSIQQNSINLNSEILIAECKSRRIKPVSSKSESGFQVAIRESRAGVLEVAITDLDGETSLRELNIDARSNQAKAPLEREIALIIESVIRRWERKQATSPTSNPSPPSQAPPPAETAEPERRPASLGTELAMPADGLMERFWRAPYFELLLNASAGLGRDRTGTLLVGGLSVCARYGDRLKLGVAARLHLSDVETDTPLIDKRGDFSEWSAGVHAALSPIETLPEWLIGVELGIGQQSLSASEGFDAEGVFSVLSVGTEWQWTLLELGEGHQLNLSAGAYADWNWIGPAFTWEPELVAYRPSRLELRGEAGLAWRF